jgi:hypothetical protein
MTLGQIVIAPSHWTKNLCVFDANTYIYIDLILDLMPREFIPRQSLINFAYTYWPRVGIFLAYLLKVGIYFSNIA